MRRRGWRLAVWISGSTAAGLRVLVSQAQAAFARCRRSLSAVIVIRVKALYTPYPYIATAGAARNPVSCGCHHRRAAQAPDAVCATMPRMTLVEATYELQKPLAEEQLRALGTFANTYGLRRVRDGDTKHLFFEYSASRLRDAEM